MIRIRQGTVTRITAERPGITEVLVETEGGEAPAVSYDHLTGPIAPGDTVTLNTTAVHKALGTGGFHFVMANHSAGQAEAPARGHIMKMRYTPCQVKVLAVEEEDSPHAAALRGCQSLERTPVVIGELHSMVGPAAAAIHVLKPALRVVYVMTDGGALPLAFSRLVHRLRKQSLIHATVTCGHAFGGDYEAVNIYSGLLAARSVAGADVIILAMGPGIVGTGSTFGHTGLEQGQAVNAVHALGGMPIAIPRISFADMRARHQGLSHHTITALSIVALARSIIAIPILDDAKMQVLNQQLHETGLAARHDVRLANGDAALEGMRQTGLRVKTMGRSPEDDPAFFLACGAAARIAVLPAET